jgi:4-hydroxythreonine-4-phosphate dehydrogenase
VTLARPMPPLALTMGEPAGIGGELTLKAWQRRADGVPPFLALDDPERLAALARRLGIDVEIAVIAAPEDAAARFDDALPVLPVALPVAVVAGRPTGRAAPAVIASIERAVALTQAGGTAALVTNPIHKETLYAAGFAFPGHTEFLAHAAGCDDRAVMMLACPALRVVPVTVHLPLAAAIAELSEAAIIHAGRVTARALSADFAIARPRLRIAALNPHGGEGGQLGSEEKEIIAPAVAALKAQGIDASGPHPADTLFHARARSQCDAVICMYHDQALIPLKTIDFDGGVNITLGLPLVRTSPDHGTAFDIAGTGKARPDSLIAALKMAARIAANRSRARNPALA